MASKYLSLVKNAIKKSMDKDVEVAGVTYTLTPPTTRDEFLLAEKLAEATEDGSDLFSSVQGIRARTIAGVLSKIDGEEIPEVIVLEDGTSVDRVLFLMEDLLEWPATVVNALFSVVKDYKGSVRDNVRSTVKYEWFGTNLLEEEDKEEEEERAMQEMEENTVGYTTTDTAEEAGVGVPGGDAEGTPSGS